VLAPSLLPGYDFINNTAGAANDWGDLDSTTRNLLLASDPNPASKSYDAVINQSTGVILDQSTGVILDGGGLPAAFGHGTMVAGIVHLVAPTAKLMPLRAFDANGTAHLSDILRAIYFAADSGVHVINMSFSLTQSSEELSAAVKYAQDKGSICVAAAGNTGTSYVASPANLDSVMGIASTTFWDTLTSFTSYGAGVFLAAPGQDIVTTYPGNNYAQVSGTSFSTPFVTGTVALLYQYFPTAGSDATHSYLTHAVPVSSLVGNGRLDIYQTLDAASLASSNTNP
jgi:subtilisin family serine protease